MTNIPKDGGVFTPFVISSFCHCGDVAIHGLIVLSLCPTARMPLTIKTDVVWKGRDKRMVAALGDRSCCRRRCIKQIPSELAAQSVILFLHLIIYAVNL